MNFSTMTTRSLILIALMLHCLSGCSTKDWSSASRESAGIAPSPVTSREAVLQIYGAPAWGWRGWFAMHTCIAANPANADSYSVYEVIGWRQRRGLDGFLDNQAALM